MSRRGATGLSGILLVDKPAGMTSHDVVARVRRATGEKRVGHAGTLDPMATGLLVVLVGPATRLATYLTAARKSYDARIVFGTETDTDDAEGHVVRTEPVPLELRSEEGAIAHVAALVGTHEQVPPAYSAIKRDGVTAHRAARAGNELDLEARTVEVTDAVLLGVEPGPPVAWNVSLTVSKGTYVRAIARDLGRELGTAAHLGGLRRTASGDLPVSEARDLDDLEAAGPHVDTLFVPAVRALGLPEVALSEHEAAAVANGRSVTAPPGTPAGTLAVTRGGRLLGVMRIHGDVLRPVTMIPGGAS